MADIAKAYVQIIPTAEGIKGQLNNMLSNESNEAGKSAGSKFSDGVKSALGGAAKAMVGTVAVTSTAVGALAKESVSEYADYEQLKGGIETLFGSSAAIVTRNAEKAYKTAGKSMNEYMETTITSAAAMITSLNGDTVKAAELTDMAVVDMADNVNKMGTTMEGVENAYRGFSKGTFNMLDNLALGYGGTTEEMKKLLKDAEAISGIEYNIDSYADIVQAIHVIQENMGVAGTTLKEGTETISGSISTLQSAWKNLIAGFGKSDTDLNVLINEVVESAKTVLENMLPIIEQALKGIGTFISKAAPIVAEELPKLITTALPPILDAAVDVVNALLLALPDILSALMEVLPPTITRLLNVMAENADQFVDAAVQMIETLTTGLIDNADTIIPAAVELLVALTVALVDHLDELAVAGVKIVIGLSDAIIDAREELASCAPELLSSLAEGITNFDFTEIGWETVNKFIDSIQKFAPMLIPDGLNLVINIIQGVLNGFDKLFSSGGDTVTKFGEGIESMISKSAEGWGGHLIDAFIKGIEMKHPILSSAVNKIAGIIAAPLHHTHPDTGVLANDYKWMPDMVDSFAQGINDNAWKLTAAVDSMASGIYSAMPNATRAVHDNVPTSNVAMAGIGNITIPVSIGSKHFETAVVNANQITNYRSGGR